MLVFIGTYDKMFSWFIRQVFKLGLSVQDIPNREIMLNELVVLRLTNEKEYELGIWIDWLQHNHPITVKMDNGRPWYFMGPWSIMPVTPNHKRNRKHRPRIPITKL